MQSVWLDKQTATTNKEKIKCLVLKQSLASISQLIQLTQHIDSNINTLS